VNSAQPYLVDNLIHEQMRELANQYPGGVYLHWGFWHNAEPDLAHRSADILVATNASVYRRIQSQTYKIGLYRIDTPEALSRFGGNPPPPPRRDTDLDKMLAEARAKAATPVPAAPAQ